MDGQWSGVLGQDRLGPQRQLDAHTQVVSIVTCDWKAGGVAQCVREWKKLTADPAILNVIKFGAEIDS